MERRRFLALLGLAPLVPYVPTKAYSFLGGILRPRPIIQAWPQLQMSSDMYNWVPYPSDGNLEATVVNGHGVIWDGLSILSVDDILDIGWCTPQQPQRYLRVVHDSPNADLRFLVQPGRSVRTS